MCQWSQSLSLSNSHHGKVCLVKVSTGESYLGISLGQCWLAGSRQSWGENCYRWYRAATFVLHGNSLTFWPNLSTKSMIKHCWAEHGHIICCLVGMISFPFMEQWREQRGKMGSRTHFSVWKCISALCLINKSVCILPTHLVEGKCLEPLSGPRRGEAWMRITDSSAPTSKNERELVDILYYSGSVCIDDNFTIYQTDC